jgi:hypothetical protein
VADAGPLGHAPEQRLLARLGDPLRRPADKGLVNVVRGNGGADGVEESGQEAAPEEDRFVPLNDWRGERNRAFLR